MTTHWVTADSKKWVAVCGSDSGQMTKEEKVWQEEKQCKKCAAKRQTA